jgi:hypothetical protein
MNDESALDIHTQGNQLLALTQAMLAAAKADDWEEFELLEQQRSAMLDRIFANPADAESAKLHLVDAIKEIFLLDQSICNLISQQRDWAAEELRHLRHAREGNKAYQIAADDSL